MPIINYYSCHGIQYIQIVNIVTAISILIEFAII